MGKEVTARMREGMDKAIAILEQHDCKVTTRMEGSENGIFAIYFVNSKTDPAVKNVVNVVGRIPELPPDDVELGPPNFGGSCLPNFRRV